MDIGVDVHIAANAQAEMSAHGSFAPGCSDPMALDEGD
jgi:hypothetical protein